MASHVVEQSKPRATAKSWLWIVEDYANALGAFEKAGVKVGRTPSETAALVREVMRSLAR